MQRPMATPSPCTGECRVGAQGVCRGCGRTLDEIAAWSTASEAQRAAIVKAAMARRPIEGGARPSATPAPPR